MEGGERVLECREIPSGEKIYVENTGKYGYTACFRTYFPKRGRTREMCLSFHRGNGLVRKQWCLERGNASPAFIILKPQNKNKT